MTNHSNRNNETIATDEKATKGSSTREDGRTGKASIRSLLQLANGMKKYQFISRERHRTDRTSGEDAHPALPYAATLKLLFATLKKKEAQKNVNTAGSTGTWQVSAVSGEQQDHQGRKGPWSGDRYGGGVLWYRTDLLRQDQ